MVYQDNTLRLTCWSNLMTLGWIICGKLFGCVACKTKLGNQGQFDLEDKFFFDEKVESNHEKVIDAFLT